MANIYEVDIFKDRTTSSFPLSIGTGLALEALFEHTEKQYDEKRKFEKYDIKKYKLHIFNVYTIVRNIIGATGVRDKTKVVTHKLLFNTLVEELSIIEGLYNSSGCAVALYFPNYANVSAVMNKNKDTGITKPYEELTDIYNALKSKFNKENISLPILTEKDIPTVLTENVLLTTSMASDLLMYKKIKNLSLLESHTGNLIHRDHWNKKYHPIGKNLMDIFPFNEKLLYILGDKTIVRPLHLKIRVELYELAMNNRWSSKTTEEKILNDIKKSELIYNIYKSI